MIEAGFEQRVGSGIRWQMITRCDIIEGFTIDNLNTKTIDQAESVFEELFINVREILEQNSGCCLDVEEERLKICQNVSDRLNKAFRLESRKLDSK